MVIEKLRRDYQYSILFFVFIEMMLLLVFAFISFTFEDLFSEGLIILIKCFIGFSEGKRVYPIKELDEIPLNNHVEILYIHRGYAALIQDSNQRKFLIHLCNLEPIQ